LLVVEGEISLILAGYQVDWLMTLLSSSSSRIQLPGTWMGKESLGLILLLMCILGGAD